MPTAAQMRSKVRSILDDEQSLWKQGAMWNDQQIDAALDAAQFAFIRYAYLKKQWHLISPYFTSITGTSPLGLPANYMFYASAAIQEEPGLPFYPAVLYIGWSGALFTPDTTRYVAFIRNNTVEFRAGNNNATGTLWYYQTPTRISAGSNHVEMIDPCYDAIVYHACAILQQKDWGQCQRALKNMQAVIMPLMSEPMEMYPVNFNQNTDA